MVEPKLGQSIPLTVATVHWPGSSLTRVIPCQITGMHITVVAAALGIIK